jgi:hypothetical protein
VRVTHPSAARANDRATFGGVARLPADDIYTAAMADSQNSGRDEHDDPFARIDPFAALIDGRRQLAEALASQVAREAPSAQQVAETLAIVAAHDEALTEVARAYAQGERDFEGVTLPSDRALVVSDMDAAMLIRTGWARHVAHAPRRTRDA